MGELIPSLSVDQMREVDRLAVEEYGISLLQMMENAGRSLAELARRYAGGSVKKICVLVAAGGGNNGGGGLAAARHLHNWGADVRVVLAAPEERMSMATQVQLYTLRRVGVPVWSFGQPSGEEGAPFAFEEVELAIDALLGYGLRGNPRGIYADLVRLLNVLRAPVLSLDVPSGLDADSGTVYDPCVQATATLMLALPKRGLMLTPQVGGRLYLADIGIPREVYRDLGIEVEFLFSEQSVVLL